jgi:DNA-binding transcriptional ArsR family regulator
MVTTHRRHSDAIFRAIADPTRRQILGVLRAGPQPVGRVASHFRTSRPAISKHLRLLRQAGLVKTRKIGASRICLLNPRPLRAVEDWLRRYEIFWKQNLRDLKKYIEENP